MRGSVCHVMFATLTKLIRVVAMAVSPVAVIVAKAPLPPAM